jgi:hypothetical protein
MIALPGRVLAILRLAAVAVAMASSSFPAMAQDLGPAAVLPHDSASDTLPAGAAVADANGDGRSDVLFFNMHHTYVTAEQHYLAYLYEQQADGTMRLAMRFSMAPGGVSPYSSAFGVAFGDLDGDGRAEIVLPDAAYDHLIILGRGADRYDEIKRLPLPFDFGFSQISIEDLDQDGHAEIVYQHIAKGFAIYRGVGGLNFAPPMAVMSYVSKGFVIADADGDGLRDLLVPTNSVELNRMGFAVNLGLPRQPGSYRRGGPGFFSLPTFSGVQQALSIGVGQFADDAKPEIVLLSRTDYEPDENNIMRMMQTISVYRMDSPRQYTLLKRHEYLDAGAVTPAHLRVTDLDGDGRDEIYVFRGGRLEVIRQQGDGFAPVFTPPAAPGYWNDPPLASTHFADFNGDGCRDVGYLANGYAIHYRADCPTARTTRARPAVSTPAQPAQRIKPRRGHRPRR